MGVCNCEEVLSPTKQSLIMNESDPADVLAMMTGRPHNLTCKQKEAFRMESLFFTRYTKQLEIAAGGV